MGEANSEPGGPAGMHKSARTPMPGRRLPTLAYRCREKVRRGCA